MSSGIRLRGATEDDLRRLSGIIDDLKTLAGMLSDKERTRVESVQKVVSTISSNAVEKLDEEQGGEEDVAWDEEWEPVDLYQWILATLHRNVSTGSKEYDEVVECLQERLLGSISVLSQSLADLDIEAEAEDEPDLHSPRPSSPSPSPSPPSPFALLPVEILQDIFILACTETTGLLTPLHLSQVNSFFRSIALDLKSIWSTIDDLLPIPVAQLYLSRSGLNPIRVRAGAGCTRAPSPRPFLDDWSEVLHPYTDRITFLEVSTADPDVLRGWAAVQDDSGCVFPKLETFVYVLHKDSKRGEDTVMCPIWIAFPNLVETRIAGAWANGWVSTTDPFPPPLRVLRISYIAELRMEKIVEALQAVPDLELLELDDIQDLPTNDDAEELRPVVTLSKLRTLEMSRIRELAMMALCERVVTPAVTALSVGFSRSANSGGKTFLLKFTGSHPKIERLEVSYSNLALKSFYWTTIIRNLPDLKAFSTFACDVDDEDLDILTLEDRCVQLAELSFDNELQLSTSFVERVVRTHPNLTSVVLRGLEASNVSPLAVEAIKQRVPRFLLEVIKDRPDEESATTETESKSDGSDWGSDAGWLSGDDEVVNNKS